MRNRKITMEENIRQISEGLRRRERNVREGKAMRSVDETEDINKKLDKIAKEFYREKAKKIIQNPDNPRIKPTYQPNPPVNNQSQNSNTERLATATSKGWQGGETSKIGMITGDNCPACVEFEESLPSSIFRKTFVKIDQESEEGRMLLAKYGIDEIPAFVELDQRKGGEIRGKWQANRLCRLGTDKRGFPAIICD